VADATRTLLSAKDLPRPCAIGTIPSRPRWTGMVNNARMLLHAVRQEMDDYSEQRSDAWQDSERAEDFAEQIQAIDDAIENLDAYLS
jgi:ubiquinone biosynthesis protein UbiJ